MAIGGKSKNLLTNYTFLYREDFSGTVMKVSQHFHDFSTKTFLRLFNKNFRVLMLCACALQCIKIQCKKPHVQLQK